MFLLCVVRDNITTILVATSHFLDPPTLEVMKLREMGRYVISGTTILWMHFGSTMCQSDRYSTVHSVQ